MALVLVLSMGVTAFAAETGTIKISNAIKDAEYTVYKMFNFEPVADSTTEGRYTVADAKWTDFINNEAKNYLAFDEAAGTIKWVGKTVTKDDGTVAPDNVDVSALAKAAVAYAKENSIGPATEPKTADKDGEITFDVTLGYYAIDTSLGTICALTNVNEEFVAHEKNEKPDIDKFVQEDSEINNDDKGWGKVNDADIDQKVDYKSTITVGVGATNYVMHDTMEAGLTFNNDVVVKLADGSVVDAANYTVTVSTKESPIKDGCTFEVAFNNDFIAGLAKGTQFTVYYSATLNENAKIADDGNDNTVYLSYGEDSTWETIPHKTTTYTWKMDVFKYTKSGENEVKLAGAKFQLLDKNDNVISFTEVTTVNGKAVSVPTYMVDAKGTVTEITTDENGKFELVGLDEGSYKLRETEAPAGYNKLAADIDVIITSEYNEKDLTASYKINNNTPATIKVENKTGGLLPETGGIGTTIFYIVGIALMLGAAILLISKKKMAAKA